MCVCNEFALKVKELNKGLERKAYVLTFGCQQNEADSEKLAGMAKEMGDRKSVV